MGNKQRYCPRLLPVECYCSIFTKSVFVVSGVVLRDSTQTTKHAASWMLLYARVLDDGNLHKAWTGVRGRGWNLDPCSSGRPPPPQTLRSRNNVLSCMKVPEECNTHRPTHLLPQASRLYRCCDESSTEDKNISLCYTFVIQ